MRIHYGLAVAMVAMLSACGGGGDGASTSSPVTVKFNSENYVSATKEAFSGVSNINSVGSLAVGVDSASKDLMFKVTARKAIRELSNKRPKRLNIASGLVEEYSEPCSGGGTVSVVESDKDGNIDTVDPGDSVTLTFDNCRETEGTVSFVLNGDMTATVVSYNDDVAKESGVVDVLTRNLNFTSTLRSGSLNGSFSVGFTCVYSSGKTDLNMSVTDSLVAKVKFTNADEKTWIYSNGFKINVSHSAVETTMAVSGKASTADLGSGSITYSTQTPLRIPLDPEYPVAGVMTLKAEAGGTTKIEATASPNAKVSLDQNDDGLFETSTLVPWRDILNR